MDENEKNILEFPSNIIFPNELNRYLKEQIIVLVQENALLQRNVEETEQKRAELEKLLTENVKKQQDNTSVLPIFAQTSNVNAKVIELSKNLREKCSELEKFKTRCSKLLTVIEDLKTKKEEHLANPEPSIQNEEIEQLKRENKQLQDKLVTSTSKILQKKNENFQLKNQLRHMEKQLQQETGTDLQQINSNTWKGRAQIIADLQEKNRVLKEKLNKTPAAAMIPHGDPKVCSKIVFLEQENLTLKEHNENLKQKIDASKSRSKMLEIELENLKGRLQESAGRSQNDMELISSLTHQLRESDQMKRCAIKDKDLTIDRLKLQLNDCQIQIENYKLLMKKSRRNSVTDVGIETEPVYFCEERVALLQLLEMYKNQLDQERNEHGKTQRNFRIERRKTVKLEAAIAKSTADLDATNRTSYTSLSQSSKMDDLNIKHQLEIAEENIKVLSTRLQLEQNERKRDFDEFSSILTEKKKTNQAN
ncbi:hypothetical protein ABEB36_006456 [Hypothenemus hampei]|uniref:Coiled-coil domain-containing protein 13 n=1 Tax=Hypothenemus hampei TaxID=57062 RepID=A0ABD1ESU9_HYPHA